jgi:glycosyltransferase involved in cell wall biosynthesis
LSAGINANHEPEDFPEELKDIKHPVAGFVGGISDWVDVSLIAAAARQLPEVNFVLIGPVLADVSCFTGMDNVRLLGAKPYKNLPAYVRNFDVCLVPFKINKLTESVNPIKMFEYLAAGKPVISTPLPEVLAYRDVVTIAEGEQETVAGIRAALEPTAHSGISIGRRQQVARENSWDARWRKAAELIEDCR